MTRRRESFDRVADLYRAARPDYPTALVEDLCRACGLGPGARALEIGPGAGQLTRPMAETGAEVLALELGPRLAALARHRVADHPRAIVRVQDFDRWSPERRTFDAVVAGTSFHWLDPQTRVERCAEALRPAGTLAVIDTRWGLAGVGDDFQRAVQDCYRRWDPDHVPAYRPLRLEELPVEPDTWELRSPFTGVRLERYPVERSYTAAAYVDLLGTFSNVIGLPDARRAGFLRCVSDLITSRFGGRIERLDVYDLWIARNEG